MEDGRLVSIRGRERKLPRFAVSANFTQVPESKGWEGCDKGVGLAGLVGFGYNRRHMAWHLPKGLLAKDLRRKGDSCDSRSLTASSGSSRAE
jgi:hypothetical protein